MTADQITYISRHQGRSIAEIAKALNVTTLDVRDIYDEALRQKRVSISDLNPEWPTYKKEKLIRLWNYGMPTPDIAKELGYTTKQVACKIYRLRVSGVALETRHKSPQAFDNKTLIELWNAGWTAGRIAEYMNYEVKTIQNKITSLKKKGENLR